MTIIPNRFTLPVWSWIYDSACANYDPELWFPPRDRNLYMKIATQAKDICFGRNGYAPCPVRLECLKEAMANEEEHGIWGGLSHRERNALKRKYTEAGVTLEEWLENGWKYKRKQKKQSVKASGNPEAGDEIGGSDREAPASS